MQEDVMKFQDNCTKYIVAVVVVVNRVVLRIFLGVETFEWNRQKPMSILDTFPSYCSPRLVQVAQLE